MRTKVTLVLIFLNVALFFFIFYLKSNIHPPTDHSSILGPEVANIQSIEISGIGRAAPIRIEKRGESWILTQPLEWPANEFAVNAIVNELEQLHSEASFAVKDLEKNGQSLADYGLDKPPLTVTIVGGGSGTIPAKSTVLQIGDTAKVGNRLYILSPDRERVHVVHRSLAESLLVKLDDLRSNIIFSILVFEVRSLNLQDPTGSKVRIAHGESRWVFETPITARANKNDTDVTVSQLDALRIRSFTDQRAPEALKLSPEEMTLRITLEGDNRRETLIVGARLPDQALPPPTLGGPPTNGVGAPPIEEGELYYAKMEDKNSLFTVSIPRNLLETLRNAQEKLRDRQILDVDPSAVSSVTLTASGQPDLTLQRLEANSKNPLSSAWQLVRRSDDHTPQTLPADREIVDRLIQHLCQLSAIKFEADAPIDSKLEFYGFSRPARQIRIALAPSSNTPGATAPSPNILNLGIGEDRHVYAKLDSPNYVYLVSDDILQQTPVESLAYRERVLRDLPAGAKITALKLVDLGTQTVLLDVPFPLPNTEPPTQASTGALLPEKRAAVELLATQLRTLRAKRFVRDQFTKTILVSGEERPWKYQLTTTLSLVGGNGAQTVTSTLFISEREGGNTQFIGAPDVDFNVVFTAEQPLIDALFAITYGPHDPGPTTPKPGSDN